MTRFDAGRPIDLSRASARATVASHPGIVLLSMILAGLAITLACGSLIVGRGAQVQLARTVEALQLSVYLQPQTGRADAEALRDRILAVPGVVDARLRTREDALTTLALPALNARANPLPDVWLVSVGHGLDGTRAALPARIANLRAALGALPGVDTVRVDSRWIDLLDRASGWIDRGVEISLWCVASILLGSLLGLFVMSGRALSAAHPSGQVGRRQALATVGMAMGLGSLALAGALLAAIVAMAPDVEVLWRPIAASMVRADHGFIVGAGLAIVMVSSIGTALGLLGDSDKA